MKQIYFLGIDNGGSSSKCVVFDEHGNSIAEASGKVDMLHPAPGYTERDGEALWLLNCRLINEVSAKIKDLRANISGVSVCGYGGGSVFVDSRGNLMSPVIISTDSRAEKLLDKFKASGIENAVYERTLQRLWPGQQASLLAYAYKYEPDRLKGVSYVMSVKDFIRFRLTGTAGTDRTDASNTNLFNIYTQQFDKEIFNCLGIKELFNLMPDKLFSPFDISGSISSEASSLTGLPEGTPVVTGLYDGASCMLASNILDESKLSAIAGTWNMSSHLTKSLKACYGKNNTLCSFLEGYYLSEESAPTSLSNLDWFVNNLFKHIVPEGNDIYEYLNRSVSETRPEDSDLIFLPYLYSSPIPHGRAGFFNLSSHHTTKDIVAAVYEGILFELLSNIRTLYGADSPALIRFSGGASKSPVWCQMLSDISNTPVEVMKCNELGALGAAICASVATGTYKNVSDATSQMCHVRAKYIPDTKKSAVYASKYKMYLKAADSLKYFHSYN